MPEHGRHLWLAASNGEIRSRAEAATPELTLAAQDLDLHLQDGNVVVMGQYGMLDNDWAEVEWDDAVIAAAFNELIEIARRAYVCVTYGEQKMYFDPAHEEAYQAAHRLLGAWCEQSGGASEFSHFASIEGRTIPKELIRVVLGLQQQVPRVPLALAREALRIVT